MNQFLSSYKYHLYLLFAGFVFSGLTVFSALLTKQGVDPFNQVFWRVVFGAVLCLLLARVIFKQKLGLTGKEIFFLVINSLWFIFGYLLFGQNLSFWGFVGVGGILLSVLLV